MLIIKGMDAVSQIKQNLNIIDVVGMYVELKKSGKNYKGVCPFHSENTPSFMVSPDLQRYKCFGCGESGDMFNFVEKMEGVDFVSAMETLAEKAGVKIEKQEFDPHAKKLKTIYEINELASEFYSYILHKHPSGKQGLDYLLNKRKLKIQTIKDFNLGFAPDTWDTLYKYLLKKGHKEEDLELAGVIIKRRSGDGYIDKFRNRIIFPLENSSNKTVGFMGRTMTDATPKYLNTSETPAFNKSSFIYGLNKAKTQIKKQGVVMVEGQVDVISAYQVGIENVVATSGTALTSNHLKMLARYTNELIFCFDSDTAGVSATLRAVELAEALDFNIKAAIIPSGSGDLDELILKSAETAKKVVNEPVPIYDYFMSSSLKKHNKSTASGKRKIMEEMGPKLKKIKNAVVLDHYTTTLAEELDLDKKTIQEAIKNSKALNDIIKPAQTNNSKVSQREKASPEEYILSLILHADLQLAQNILYKLGKKDFTEESTYSIFTNLKDYALGRKRKIDIEYFISKLESKLQKKAEEIYMEDISTITKNEELLAQELKATFNRIKRERISRELKEIKEEIKLNEMSGDMEAVQSLLQKVYKISKLKRQYEQN